MGKFKSVWLKSKKAIIIIPVIIATISALLANTQSILNFFKGLNKKEEKKGVQIVDATFVTDSINTKPQTVETREKEKDKKEPIARTSNSVSIEQNTIDIKIRNNGNETVVLKEIILSVKRNG